ncbi:MAG: hypothetical protein DCF30_02755 [Hyphomicrobiales bacterium]|nr:MAG: hypothetical protein DCF30_02755 [Hyphomicrobiales bacterium]
MTNLPFSKLIDIADFANPELLPFLQEISRGEMNRFGLTEPLIIPDSKQWECAMMLRVLSECGTLRPGALIAGIGAGTEETTFALAARGCVVFPTDRYLEVTPWSDVAPAAMMVRPEQYTQLEHDPRNVIPVHTDARALSLPSDFFDAVYSAGSIEHFGSLEAVRAAAEEIGRVLKPGGVAVLSTEFRLEGPNDKPWFDDNCILFTPELIRENIVEPSGLEWLGAPDFAVSKDTFDSRVVLLDFLDKAKNVKTIEDKRNCYPNLILFHEGYLFCSVHIALKKPENVATRTGVHSAPFRAPVKQDSVKASAVLTEQIREWTAQFRAPPVNEASVSELKERISSLEAEWHRLSDLVRHADERVAIHERSRSFRLTRPMRDLARLGRQNRIIRAVGSLVLRAFRRVKRALTQQ